MRDGEIRSITKTTGLGCGSRRLDLVTVTRQYGLVVAFVVICIIMGLVNARFLSVANIRNIALQSSINIILTCGVTFCLISGGLDLSVGSIGVAAGCLAAITMIGTGSMLLGVFVGLLSGTLAGLTNGLVITRMKVPPFVTTLAMMTIGRGIALLATGGLVISGLPASFTYLGTGNLSGIPVPALIAGAVAVASWFLLSKTEFGLHIYATGGNYEAARLSGVDTLRVITIVYTYSGFLAAVAGLILTARVLSAQPALMQTSQMDAIAAAVVGGTKLGGGRGNIGGSVLGAVLMGSLFNGLNIVGVGYEMQLVIIGAILIFSVYFDILSHK